MADRNLKIGLKVDTAAGKEFQKLLSDLSAQGNKTAKALAGISIGGSGPTKGALAKSILEQKKAFEGLGKEAKNVADILNKVVGKGADDLSKKISKTTKEIKELERAYGKAQKELSFHKEVFGTNAMATRSQEREIQRLQGRITNRMGRLSVLQNQQAAYEGGGAAGGGGGFLGGLGGKIGGAAMAATILAGVGGISSGYLLAQSAPLSNAAGAAGFYNDLLRRTSAGDFTSMAAMLGNMDPAKAKETLNKMGYIREGAGVNHYIQNGLGIVGNAMRLSPSGVAGNFAAMRAGGAQGAQAQAMLQAIQDLKGASPNFNVMLEDFQANAAGAAVASNLFGGEGAYRRGVHSGARFGFGRGESVQIMNQLSDVMGSSRGNGFMDMVAGSERQMGLGRGAAAGALGALMIGNSGDSIKTKEGLQQVMAKAFSQGIKDSKLNEEIAGAITAGSFGAGGRRAGAADVFAILNAAGSNPDLQHLRSTIGAMNSMDQFMSGRSGGGGMRAAGFRAASMALGGGNFNVIDQIALGNASFRDILKGSDQLNQQLGPNSAAIRKRFAEIRISQLMHAMDPSIQSAFNNAGGSMSKFLGGLSGQQQARIKSEMQNMGIAGDFEEAGQMLALMSNLDPTGPGKGAIAKMLKGHKGSSFQGFASAQANANLFALDESTGKDADGRSRSDKLRNLAQISTTFLNFADKFGDVMAKDPSKVLEATAVALLNVGDAAEILLKKVEPYMKDKPAASDSPSVGSVGGIRGRAAEIVGTAYEFYFGHKKTASGKK